MNVFVVNCGSSSIKYQLFSMRNESVVAKGVLERVGTKAAILQHTYDHQKHTAQVAAPTHADGMKLILETLTDPKIGVLRSIDEIAAVGHRVVSGGETLVQPCLIDSRVVSIIESLCPLAPLHNPANLQGILAARQAMPNTPNVAVFDTAFMATLPPKAYRYAVPEEWYTQHHVRKYGFHGTSHRYVTAQAAELLGKPQDKINLITVHLGNGCSMTAVVGGKAVDHSMGLTPLEGLVMGTRSGDLDPAITFYMIAQGLTAHQVDNVLNKKSGLLGVSGLSNDMRDLLAASDAGHAGAKLALEMFVYRIVKYIGAYYVVMPSVDAVVMTGGIGENSFPIRREVVRYLSRLGARPDDARNEQTIGGKAGPITADGSTLPVWVVPTNEELTIARDTWQVVKNKA